MLQISWRHNKTKPSVHVIKGLLWFGLCLFPRPIFLLFLLPTSGSVFRPWVLLLLQVFMFLHLLSPLPRLSPNTLCGPSVWWIATDSAGPWPSISSSAKNSHLFSPHSPSQGNSTTSLVPQYLICSAMLVFFNTFFYLCQYLLEPPFLESINEISVISDF